MTHWRFRSRLKSSTGKVGCTQAPRWASCGRFQAHNWMRATGQKETFTLLAEPVETFLERSSAPSTFKHIR